MNREDFDNFGVQYDDNSESEFEEGSYSSSEEDSCVMTGMDGRRVQMIIDIEDDLVYRVPKSLEDDDDEKEFKVTRKRPSPNYVQSLPTKPQKRQVRTIEEDEVIPASISDIKPSVVSKKPILPEDREDDDEVFEECKSGEVYSLVDIYQTRKRDAKHEQKFERHPSEVYDMNGSVSEDEKIDRHLIDSLKDRPSKTKAACSEDLSSFDSYPEISRLTVHSLQKRGIKNLFPSQQECFYPIYGENDIIGRDLTGSGKTLAFALPLVERFRAQNLLGSRQV